MLVDSDEPLTDEERDREMALALQRQLNYQEQGVAAQQQVITYYINNCVAVLYNIAGLTFEESSDPDFSDVTNKHVKSWRKNRKLREGVPLCRRNKYLIGVRGGGI